MYIRAAVLAVTLKLYQVKSYVLCVETNFVWENKVEQKHC